MNKAEEYLKEKGIPANLYFEDDNGNGFVANNIGLLTDFAEKERTELIEEIKDYDSVDDVIMYLNKQNQKEDDTSGS